MFFRSYACCSAVMIVALASCTRSGDGPPASLTRNIIPADSAVNPIIVQVDTIVAESALQRVVEEVRIEPGVNDISTFTDAHEFVVDGAGAFWVYDDPSNSISVFDSTGRFVRKIGRTGSGPGELKLNGGMVVLKDGRLAVMDVDNARVSFFSSVGKYVSAQRFSEGAFRFRALTSDTSGALYIKRTFYDEVVGNTHPPSHETLIQLRTDGQDVSNVPDLGLRRAEYEIGSEDHGSTTALMVTIARYAPEMLWDWHPDGYFVTGHGARNEITLFRRNARAIRIERKLAPVSVAADERKEEEQSILGDPTRPWRGPPLPTSKPPLMALFVAKDGRIWTRVPMPSERSRAANPDKRPGRPDSVVVFRTPVVWEFYSSEGAFLARIPFPGYAKVMQARGNHVWAIQLGKDDLPALVRYRIETR